MRKYLFINAIFLFLLISPLLCGCIGTQVENDHDRFLGTWKTNQGLIFTFYQNKTCMMQGWFSGHGTWEISGSKLNIKIDFTDGINYMAYDYNFSGDDTILTLTDAGSNSWVYSKQ